MKIAILSPLDFEKAETFIQNHIENLPFEKVIIYGGGRPHLPSDLDFYDLRLPEAREVQAQLAKDHGIYGFCYYHYWFNGKRLFGQSIDEMLRLKEPGMPFMLCWTSENWIRRWDGLDNEILIKQNYSFEYDKEHIRWLCEKVFPDVRYIRVNDCPVFMIYRHDLFPDIEKTATIWRKIAVEEFGFKGLYLCVIESFNNKIDPKSINFDAAVEFAPHSVIRHRIKIKSKTSFLDKLKGKKTSKLIFVILKKELNRVKIEAYQIISCIAVPHLPGTTRLEREKRV